MATMTEAFRKEHSRIWNEYREKIDEVGSECRAAEIELNCRQKNELNAEDERHHEAEEAIYRKYDLEREPVRKPFKDRIDALLAERGAAFKRLEAEHGIN